MFLNAIVGFLIAAAVIYFGVVMPVQWLLARREKEDVPAQPATKKCAECLSDIPLEARRCAHCAQPVGML